MPDRAGCALDSSYLHGTDGMKSCPNARVRSISVRLSTVCLGLLLSAGQASGTTVIIGTVIDSFDAASPQTTNLDFLPAPPTRNASSVGIGASSDIIGGERELSLEVTANPGLQASVNVLPILGGVLNVNNGAGVVSVSSVLWDGIGSGSLSVDLTRGGLDDLFALDLISVDQSASVTFTVEDLDGDLASLTRTGLLAGIELYNFADFSNLSATDFTNVKSIEMIVTGPDGVDLNLDLFGAGSVVPSPSSVIAIQSLVLLLGVTSCRRKR